MADWDMHWSIAIGADPKRYPVDLGEKLNSISTGKQRWFVRSFCREGRICPYLKAAESVGSTKKYNVLHLSSKHLVVCCNQGSKSLSLLFLQTTFFVVDIWSGETFL